MPNLEALLRQGRRIRTIGIDDGPFERGQRSNVVVVGAVCAATRFEGLLTTSVRPDGFNATKRLISMICESKFSDQLHAILLDGITLGGFNVVDISALNQATGRPVIAVTRRKPDLEAVYRVANKLTNSARRRRTMDVAGPLHVGESVCFQVCGLEPEVAAAVLTAVTDTGNLPESLRLAHLIARGIVLGESGNRA